MAMGICRQGSLSGGELGREIPSAVRGTIFRTIESYLITNGYVKTYTNLNLDRVKCLRIVIDIDEARNTSQVVELLEWLSAIGLKKICLYDQEGAVEADPYLLLIYGPVRCHLGFPAWRIRYTEMAHMGPFKYKKFGLIMKAIHRFTKDELLLLYSNFFFLCMLQFIRF
ncbi:putative decaprenyl diphosphate synthase-like superfamily [Helianthus anomalus]